MSSGELKRLALTENGAGLEQGFEVFRKQAQAGALAEAKEKLATIDGRLVNAHEFGDLKLIAAQKMYIAQQMRNTEDPEAMKTALSWEKMDPRVGKIYSSEAFQSMCSQLGAEELRKQVMAGGEKLVASYAKVMAGQSVKPQEPLMADFNTRPPVSERNADPGVPVLRRPEGDGRGGMPH